MRLRIACVLVMMFAFIGCSDATKSQWSSLGQEHKIELWSGGKKVQEWTSTGKVMSESNSDGYFFCDKTTKKLVRVTGDLVITAL